MTDAGSGRADEISTKQGESSPHAHAADRRYIGRLPAKQYRLRRPIPYVVRRDAAGSGFTALLSAARVVAYGETEQEAEEALPFVILDTFELLLEAEGRLAAWPRRQLSILSQYVDRAPGE